MILKKLRNHFTKIGLRQFLFGTVIALIITDLINSYYLRLYWLNKNLSILYIKVMTQKQGIPFQELGPEAILEFKNLMDNGFYFFLFVVLLNNLFFYAFYLRKKKWAQNYIAFYTITNSILAVLFLVEGPIMGYAWFSYNLLSMFFYLYLYLGIKSVKWEEPSSSPEGENTEQ